MSIAAVTIQGLYQRHISFGVQTGDSNPPVYTAGPAIGTTADSYVQVTATMTDLNPPITIYGVAVADAASAPTEAQIIAGTDSGDTPVPKGQDSEAASGSPLAFSIPGLTASTAYDIYVTAKDVFGNITTKQKLDVTTTAASAYDRNDTVRGVVSGGARMVRSVVDDVT